MMKNLFYTPFDLALLLNEADPTISEELEILEKIFQNERAFIDPEYWEKKEHFFKMVQKWRFYLIHNEKMGFTEKEIFYSTMPPYDETDYYFKRLRYRLTLGNLNFIRVKLRTLLSVFGTEKPAPSIIQEIENILFFYHLSFCRRGMIEARLRDFELDEWIMIRLL